MSLNVAVTENRSPCRACSLADLCASESLACKEYVAYAHGNRYRSRREDKPTRVRYERLFGATGEAATC